MTTAALEGLLAIEKNSIAPAPALRSSRVNATWRRRVVTWFSSVIQALSRRDDTERPDRGVVDQLLFRRLAIHNAVHLLDSHIMMCDEQQSIQFRNSSAYQILATACLQLGLRLAKNHIDGMLRNDARQVQEECQGLHRSKRVENLVDVGEAVSNTADSFFSFQVPTAEEILRLSTVPGSMSEKQLIRMLGEITETSRSSLKLMATAPLFIDAGCRRLTTTSDSLTFSQAEANEALRLADAYLLDSTSALVRPSVVACAAITVAIRKASQEDLLSLRRKVHRKIFGHLSDSSRLREARKVEARLQSHAMRSSRHRHQPRRENINEAHLIPLDE
mmetsp:Transcript_12507/g.29522  ORF Transcript_12507/g.29522 Transcript_12507/m.29522 type:complete len:333 (-) Transcript_12507:386-1384(-)